MPLKLIDHNSTEYHQMVDLRYHLLRKPLGLDFTKEELEREKNDILIGCFEEDKLKLAQCRVFGQGRYFTSY